MKINYVLDNKNIIVSWTRIPFNAELPWIEVEDTVEIHPGYDKIIKGKLVQDFESYNTAKQAELLKLSKFDRIRELKSLLNETDYLALKFADGVFTEEEYAPIRSLRQSYRDEINVLETEIASL